MQVFCSLQVLGSQTGIPKGLKQKWKIPEGRGGGERFWNSEGKEGMSILEFPRARGGENAHATRGRIWIFSGITHSLVKDAG